MLAQESFRFAVNKARSDACHDLVAVGAPAKDATNDTKYHEYEGSHAHSDNMRETKQTCAVIYGSISPQASGPSMAISPEHRTPCVSHRWRFVRRSPILQNVAITHLCVPGPAARSWEREARYAA